ncbi:hypothetical protein QQF64_003165 [Cirrhinus molitorella]|uniref:Uncharacterized protein n=1 Tax=Cirrhinus molitorella TaxID=172907 RepID=A0ABR3MJ96_9TELE
MTNVGNEFGQVLNCVLTTGEGVGLDELCQGIVKRSKDAGEPEPAVIYVDRDCCSKTEHHPLYGTFCSKLSSYIFEWDKDDICNALHAQMYIQGASRWNISWAHQAVDMSGPGYLVSLNRTITALSTNEIVEILRLYSFLHAIDQSPSKYSLKCKKRFWKGLGELHGSVVAQPLVSKQLRECVALKLLKEFRKARNRPKDNKGKSFPIPQVIVMTYSHIKQLLDEDCREILDKTNLVLVTINNTTVSSWLLDRQKRTDRDTLLQGVQFPQPVGLAN